MQDVSATVQDEGFPSVRTTCHRQGKTRACKRTNVGLTFLGGEYCLHKPGRFLVVGPVLKAKSEIPHFHRRTGLNAPVFSAIASHVGGVGGAVQVVEIEAIVIS